jgi:hypothetical protein
MKTPDSHEFHVHRPGVWKCKWCGGFVVARNRPGPEARAKRTEEAARHADLLATPWALRMETEVNDREAFERFFAQRKNKGAKWRDLRFARLPADDTYADESVQRHWWTWQCALDHARAAAKLGEDLTG